jgi:eukaryotic-like serine/threonine-protein kinase
MIGARLGNWVIDREIGQGGMGCVYLAHEAAPEGTFALAGSESRQAAVKVLAPGLAVDAGFIARFQREIDVLRQLYHPNIVRFYDSGAQDNHYYYVMEYVAGGNLEEEMAERGRLPWAEVLDLALQIAPALKHAHDRGIIHRDLKPSNLVRARAAPSGDGAAAPFGVVKLTDFGIAKVFATTHLTATGGVVGTAEYLSPEQAAGKPVSKRSDLYSFGAVLYTLLTGRTPFQGESIVDLLHKHRFAQFERPARLVPELPHDLDEVVCQLLEKDPARRPADAGVLHRQLDSIGRKLERKSRQTAAALGETVALPPEERDQGPGPATLMSRLMRQELESEKRGGPVRRFFNRPLVLTVLLLLTLGGIVWGLWPVSAETLFQSGAALMRTDNPDDWDRASSYFDRLSEKYPDNAHRDEVEQFRKKIADHHALEKAETRAQRAGPVSEAQWFYEEGLRLRQRGDAEGAERLWKGLVQSFRDVPSEQPWVRQAELHLKKPDERILPEEKRWEPVRVALQRARELRDGGKPDEAEAIWQGLEELYQKDPSAAAVLEELRHDRGK